MVHDEETPAQIRRAEKTDALLDEAMQLVVEHGIEGLTVARLARRMKWTKGAMYRYFSGKGPLIAALNERVIVRWTHQLDETLAQCAGEPVLAQLSAAVERYIDLAHDEPARFSLVSLTLAAPKDLVENVDEASHIPAMMTLLGRIVSLVDAAQQTRALTTGDPLGRTLQLVFALQGVMQLKKLARFDAVAFDTRALAARTAADLLVAWESR